MKEVRTEHINFSNKYATFPVIWELREGSYQLRGMKCTFKLGLEEIQVSQKVILQCM